MALEKIRPRVVDETGNYTFNNVIATGSLLSANANISNIVGITNIVANTTTITVTGNLTTTSNISAGNIKTDNLLYANGNPWSIGASSTPPGGSNTQVQFNDAGSFNGNSNFTFNKTTNTLTVTNISSNGAGLSNLTASNITGQVGNALVAGTIYTNAQPNITSVGTLTDLAVTGTITSGNANLGNATISNYFIGNGSLLSSITGSNITGQVGYAAVANSVSGSNVSGPVTYAATANAVSGANVMGNVSGAVQTHYANIANSVAGSNVSGAVSSATTAGTVTTAAQPNITSVGSLTGLVVSNVTGVVDFTTTANVTLGAVGNVRITGGTNGYVLSTNGSGGLSWVAQSASYSNTNVAAYLPTYTGNLTSGNANLGNAVVANYFVGNGAYLTGVDLLSVGNSDTANRIANGTSNINTPISGGNITVGIGGVSNTVIFTSTGVNVNGYLSATGNIKAGNANLGNAVVANYFVGNGAYLTGVDLLSVGNSDTANRIANGTSNINTPTINGNITVGIGGTSNTVIFTSTGINVAGYISPSTGSGTNGIIWPANPGGGTLDVASIQYYAVSGEQTRLEINVQNDVPGASQDDIYFTTNSYVVVNNATEATSTSSAPFQVLGGAGIAKKLYVGGNIEAGTNYIKGNGYYLTGVDQLSVGNADVANSIANGTSNISTPTSGGNITVGIGGVANTVIFTSTGVNVAGTLNVGGNAIVGNLTVSGTTTTVNSTTTRVVDPIFELGGGANGAALATDDNKDRGLLLHYYTGGAIRDAFIGWDDSNGEFGVGSNVSVASEVVTWNNYGNLRAEYFLGNGYYLSGVDAISATYSDVANSIANGTSSVNTPIASGNITVSIGGVSNTVVFTGTGINVAGYANITSGISTAGTITLGSGTGGNLTGANVLSANTIIASANLTAGNIAGGNLISANYISGNGYLLTGISAGSATSVVNGNSNISIVANSNASISIAGTSNVVVITSTGVNVSGYVSATRFVGEAGNVSNIQGANVSGNVSSAVQAHYANIANSVAGSNVSGQVTYAATANSVAGANVSGNVTGAVQAHYANIANSVAGSNVSGNVSSAVQAHYANIANSVAVSNVSGIGNIATINIDGNASNILYGNGAFAAAPAGGGGSYANSNVATFLASYGSNTITTTGNVSVGNIIGNGQALTSITGSNVSGNVTSAIQSHYANIANSIAGANVSGNVSSAVQAHYANIANSVAGSNVSGQVTYAGTANSVAGSNVSGAVSSATTAGTVTTAAQGNITSVGTLTGLTSTGIINLTGTSNVALGEVGNVKITGGTNGYVLSTDGSGGLSWVAQSGGGSYANSNVATFLGSYGSNTIVTTGNISVGNIIGNGQSLTSITGANVSGNVTSAVQSHYANIANSVAGSNVSGAVSSATTAGTVTTAAQGNITSVGTLTSLGVTGTTTSGNFATAGNITASFLVSNVTTGTAPLTVTSTTRVANLNVDYANTADNINVTAPGTGTGYIVFANATTGNVSEWTSAGISSNLANNSITATTFVGALSGSATSATTAGTVTTAAQGNITSVGTLTGLTVNGLTNLGAVGNITITGGTNGYVLQTNGSGVLSWVAQSGGGGGGSAPTITDDTTTNATYYPVYATASSGSLSTAGVSSTKLQFNPSLGQLTVTDLNSLSDATLKTNWQTIDDPFSILDQLFGMGFDWLDNGRKSYGLSAQNVEKILPELVGTTAQGKKTVNYIPIIAFLLEALKKNNKELQEIKNSIQPKS